jgi:hypothetical protein
MANEQAGKAALAALSASRDAALDLAHAAGARATNDLLRRSAADLEARIRQIAPALGEDSFTVVQLRATLAQVRHVLATVTVPGLRSAVVEQGGNAAGASAQHVVDYLAAADRAYRGVGEQPIALRPAAMLESAARGTHSSLLSRLAHGVDRRGRKARKAKAGILGRYGLETIGHFEKVLQRGLVAKRSWIEMRGDITRESPFLQGAPAFWAHRIVRTEIATAYGAAAHHSIVEAGKRLDGMLKIISETFDDRTAWDSYNGSGQVRRPEEDFEFVAASGETWLYPHPANRPNDRSALVPHRARWPLPDELRPRTDDEVEEAWARERHKGEMPGRPLMSTVGGFGEID